LLLVRTKHLIVLQRLAMIAAWAMLVFIAYATMSPIQQRPTLPMPTGYQHLLAFVLLGALFATAYPRPVVLAVVIVIGSAVLLEAAQLLTADRHGRVIDAIEKIAGGTIGISLTQVMLLIAFGRR
jgi:VanZ family protein